MLKKLKKKRGFEFTMKGHNFYHSVIPGLRCHTSFWDSLCVPCGIFFEVSVKWILANIIHGLEQSCFERCFRQDSSWYGKMVCVLLSNRGYSKFCLAKDSSISADVTIRKNEKKQAERMHH